MRQALLLSGSDQRGPGSRRLPGGRPARGETPTPAARSTLIGTCGPWGGGRQRRERQGCQHKLTTQWDQCVLPFLSRYVRGGGGPACPPQRHLSPPPPTTHFSVLLRPHVFTVLPPPPRLPRRTHPLTTPDDAAIVRGGRGEWTVAAHSAKKVGEGGLRRGGG